MATVLTALPSSSRTPQDLVTEYCDTILRVVKGTGLATENNRHFCSLHLLSLRPELIRAATDDAASKIVSFGARLAHVVGQRVELRPAKNLNRIVEKQAEELEHSRNDVHYTNHIRPFNDLIAARVHCTVAKIRTVLDSILSGFSLEEGNYVAVRQHADKNTSAVIDENRYGAHFDPITEKKLDIIQFVYVYAPETKHITEIQVGEEFATFTFTLNSRKRNTRACGKEYTGINLFGTKLSSGSSCYEAVKQLILDRANGEITEDAFLNQKAELIEEVETAFANYKGTEDYDTLMRILSELS